MHTPWALLQQEARGGGRHMCGGDGQQHMWTLTATGMMAPGEGAALGIACHDVWERVSLPRWAGPYRKLEELPLLSGRQHGALRVAVGLAEAR